MIQSGEGLLFVVVCDCVAFVYLWDFWMMYINPAIILVSISQPTFHCQNEFP